MTDDNEQGNTAVTQAKVRDHDRVAMLSVSKDGTFDQHEPELIGDKDATLEATREQFRQQAVSNVDAELRAPYVSGEEDEGEEDPTVAELKDAHQEAEKAADSAAESAVEALLTDPGEQRTTNQPAGAAPSDSTAGVPGSEDSADVKNRDDES